MATQTHNSSVERVNAYLEEQASLDTLRFITCGSVDDGKSTLIGRMLFEAQLIFEDQVASLKSDSRKMGTQEATSTSRSWSMASPPSASRASRSTSRTDFSRPTDGSSLLPTHRATSSTHGIW